MRISFYNKNETAQEIRNPTPIRNPIKSSNCIPNHTAARNKLKLKFLFTINKYSTLLSI